VIGNKTSARALTTSETCPRKVIRRAKPPSEFACSLVELPGIQPAPKSLVTARLSRRVHDRGDFRRWLTSCAARRHESWNQWIDPCLPWSHDRNVGPARRHEGTQG
jgi:hypothetical protein